MWALEVLAMQGGWMGHGRESKREGLLTNVQEYIHVAQIVC